MSSTLCPPLCVSYFRPLADPQGPLLAHWISTWLSKTASCRVKRVEKKRGFFARKLKTATKADTNIPQQNQLHIWTRLIRRFQTNQNLRKKIKNHNFHKHTPLIGTVLPPRFRTCMNNASSDFSATLHARGYRQTQNRPRRRKTIAGPPGKTSRDLNQPPDPYCIFLFSASPLFRPKKSGSNFAARLR